MATIRPYEACQSYAGVASNSLAISNGDMIGLVAGFVVKATASTGKIIGIANGTKTYTSDNQTVAKATVNYLRVEPCETQAELVTTASITAAMVGQYFSLDSAQKVNHATASANAAVVNTSDAGAAADPVLFPQVRLDKFITATKGVFTFV